MQPVLTVADLNVTWPGGAGVRGLSLTMRAGERVAVVGRSGSGKSTLGRALLRLCDRAEVSAERLQAGSIDVLRADGPALKTLRGGVIGMIFQDPLASLDPLQRVGSALVECLRAHHNVTRAAGAIRATQLLAEVGIDSPATAMRAYPHQLSGGQRQRIGIAMALLPEPALVVADEPTSALDPPLARQVAGVLRRACAARETALMLITHDLLLAESLCTRMVVMEHGEAVERGQIEDLFAAASHRATQALLAAAGVTADPAGVQT